MEQLKNSVAVVTGGRVGLGKALATELARRGTIVIIASQSDASATVQEIRSAGGTAEWMHADVSRFADVALLARRVRGEYGRVNFLINNAGTGGEAGGLDTVDPDVAKRVFDVNITGVFNGIRAFADDLKSQGAQGRPAFILNVGSEHSLGVPPHVAAMSAYTVSKYATLAFTDTARRDFAGTGVGVSLLAPGWILTELVRRMTAHSADAAAAILPLAQESDDVARAGIDGLLRGDYIIVTNDSTPGFATEHARSVIAEVARSGHPAQP
jgi:NAD(P)-dependent dehydrogenase (short-subunit alcohol dehydrogenase family)